MKIAVFDTGVGGINILYKLSQEYNEEYIYLADNLRLPYGEKKKEEIVRYSKEIVQKLNEENVDLGIIGCNTICARAYEKLKKEAKFPLISIIDVAVENIKKNIKEKGSKSVCILSTKATKDSKIYLEKLEKENINIYSVACNNLAGYIEEKKDKKEIQKYLENIFETLKGTKIDCVVLACTHYTWAKNEIIKALEKIGIYNIDIIDPAKYIAKHIKLEKKPKEENLNEIQIYYTKEDINFKNIVCEKLKEYTTKFKKITLN